MPKENLLKNLQQFLLVFESSVLMLRLVVVVCVVSKDDHLLQVEVLYDMVDESICNTLFGIGPGRNMSNNVQHYIVVMLGWQPIILLEGQPSLPKQFNFL